MASGSGRGLFRKTRDGVWYARRAVPKDLRDRLGHERIVSLRTYDSEQAERRRDDFWLRTSEEFALARQQGPGDALTAEQVREAINRWRSARCAAAAGIEAADPADFSSLKLPGHVLEALAGGLTKGPIHLARSRAGPPTIGRDAAAAARAYFKEHPKASRDIGMPVAVAMLVGRLQVASRDPGGWRDIDGFDQVMDEALREAGVEPRLGPSVREMARVAFAAAWLEVVQHEELERQRAARYLAALEAAALSPGQLQVARAPDAYSPREGDRTVKELIAAFRKERSERYGGESTERKYSHIFTALEDVLTPDKPLRAITREDVRKLRDLLRSMPNHMGKRYPGLSMSEAIEQAAEDDAPLLAPNTVNSYLSNLSAMFNWARDVVGWMDGNPAKGFIDKSLPTVKRRGFSSDELDAIFSVLSSFRETEPWKFWVPALALYTGGRLNELCQLDRDDVRETEGISYLALTRFDRTGRRRPDVRLKTDTSSRNVALHPALIEAGFLEFVRERNTGRLFPELKPGPGGGYSHSVSRWFGHLLDRLGMEDPSLVFHSFRHGFRDACRRGDVDRTDAKILGGWKVSDVAELYGDAEYVPVLYRELLKIDYRGFSLVNHMR